MSTKSRSNSRRGGSRRSRSSSHGSNDKNDRKRSRSPSDRKRRRDIGEGNTIWIGGIDSDTREKDLDKLFGEHGNITRISIKGRFAFIEYASSRAAEKAIRQLDGKRWKDRALSVELASIRPSFPSRSGPVNESRYGSDLQRGQPMTGKFSSSGRSWGVVATSQLPRVFLHSDDWRGREALPRDGEIVRFRLNFDERGPRAADARLASRSPPRRSRSRRSRRSKTRSTSRQNRNRSESRHNTSEDERDKKKSTKKKSASPENHRNNSPEPPAKKKKEEKDDDGWKEVEGSPKSDVHRSDDDDHHSERSREHSSEPKQDKRRASDKKRERSREE